MELLPIPSSSQRQVNTKMLLCVETEPVVLVVGMVELGTSD